MWVPSGWYQYFENKSTGSTYNDLFTAIESLQGLTFIINKQVNYKEEIFSVLRTLQNVRSSNPAING